MNTTLPSENLNRTPAKKMEAIEPLLKIEPQLNQKSLRLTLGSNQVNGLKQGKNYKLNRNTLKFMGITFNRTIFPTKTLLKSLVALLRHSIPSQNSLISIAIF